MEQRQMRVKLLQVLLSDQVTKVTAGCTCTPRKLGRHTDVEIK